MSGAHEAWVRQARRDLETARALSASGYHEWACFCALNAAEKVQKAFYFAHGLSPVEQGRKGHDLVSLSQAWSDLLTNDRALAQAQTFLTARLEDTRYPQVQEPERAPFERFDVERSRLAVAQAEKLLAFWEPLVERAARFWADLRSQTGSGNPAPAPASDPGT